MALFTTVYTIAVTAALVALDEFGKIKARFDD